MGGHDGPTPPGPQSKLRISETQPTPGARSFASTMRCVVSARDSCDRADSLLMKERRFNRIAKTTSPPNFLHNFVAAAGPILVLQAGTLLLMVSDTARSRPLDDTLILKNLGHTRPRAASPARHCV